MTSLISAAVPILGILALLLAGGSPAGAGELWQPAPDARWQYQLEGGSRALAASGGINVGICQTPPGGGACVRPDVFDIDLYVDGRLSGNDHTINTAAVEAIHARGRRAVCYVSAGTAERFRPDYRKYVRFDRRHAGKLIGKPFSRVFPNEYWLNIKNGRGQRDFILRRVEARTRKCGRAGFDGVEYDVVDAYAQSRKVTGWRIRPRAQLVFNRALAGIAHRNGLSVALKNDLGQLERLQAHFDYAINEQCFSYHECTTGRGQGYGAFTRTGKAVFQVEYRLSRRRFCDRAATLGISSIRKGGDFSLDAKPWKPCS